MKHNLKNRPKYGDEGYRHVVYEKWFEGFEKELRKSLQVFIDEHAWSECSEFSVKETIKEILGE